MFPKKKKGIWCLTSASICIRLIFKEFISCWAESKSSLNRFCSRSRLSSCNSISSRTSHFFIFLEKTILKKSFTASFSEEILFTSQNFSWCSIWFVSLSIFCDCAGGRVQFKSDRFDGCPDTELSSEALPRRAPLPIEQIWFKAWERPVTLE